MRRFILLDRHDETIGDLSEEVTSAVRTEELNGEHALTFETTQELEVGTRVLTQDDTDKWREYVVDDSEETHDGKRYECSWSIQSDLAGIAGGELWAAAQEGTHDPVTASAALVTALSAQSRWEPGYVTVQTMAGASLYDGQVWDYLGKLVDVWGGEIEPRIVVDDSGVTHRYVDWLAHVGTTDVTRRFDYGEDCTEIHRRQPSGPYWCGIKPRGGNTATDDDGVDYTSRIGIEEAPACEGHEVGSPYLYDPVAKENFKRPDGHGGWEYPCLTVNYSLQTEGDEEELLALAQADLYGYTRPVPTYEASVLQFAAAGMDAHGVSLGDTVHIVDRKFGDAPLRLEARVTKVEVNELDESDVTLTIGEIEHIEDGIVSLVGRSTADLSDRIGNIEGGGTIVYLKDLLDRLNAELNITGGYYYLVPGHGIYTYDKEVTDPTIGAEADKVTQIVGGGIRFADSRDQDGDWNWTNVIDAGHIAAPLVTTVQIIAGFIGNANGNFYVDLDSGIVKIGSNAQIGGRSVPDILDGIDATVTDVDVEFAENQSADTAPTTGWSTTAPAYREGYYIWQRTATTTGHGTSATTTYSDPVRINTHDGQDGQDGTDGKGISSIVEQYYLSTSSSTQTGGSWSATPAAYVSGRYYWTRTVITWSDNTTTTTTPVLASAINSANENAIDARKYADNYLTFLPSVGVDVGYSGTSAKTRVNGSGVTIYDGNGSDRLNASTNGVRVGKSNGYHSSISDTAFELLNGSNVSTFKADSSSVRIGKASGAYHAVASKYSFSLVDDEGRTVFKVGEWDEPIGEEILQVVTGLVFGLGLLTESEWQTVLGKYNVEDSNNAYALVIGGGSSTSNRKNIFTVDWAGNVNAGSYTYFKSTNIDRDGSLPSSLTEGNARLVFRDSDNESLGRILPLRSVYGSSFLRLEAHTESTGGSHLANYFDIRVDRSGNASYAMSNPTAFREAIGMPTTSVSGDDGFETRWIGTEILSAVIDVSSFYAHKVNGRMVQFYLSGTMGVSVAANGSTVLGTIASGYRPIRNVGVDAYNSMTRRATVSTSGSVTLYTSAAIAVGASVTITGVYVSSN